MNLPDTFTTFRELAADLPLVGWGTLLTGVLIVTYRTGSGHAVFGRIWRLVRGRKTVSDECARRFIDDQSDLMAVRFESNLRVRTMGRARELANWLRDNDENVSAVRRCRHYFDLETCRLRRRLPGRRIKTGLVVAMMVFSIPAAFLPNAIVNDRVFLKISESGTWFLVSADIDRAAPFRLLTFLFGSPEFLLPETCRSQAGTVPTPFSTSDTEVVCELLESPDSPNDLSTALVSQRIALTWFLVVLVVLAYPPFRELWTIQAARQMSRRLEERRIRHLWPPR